MILGGIILLIVGAVVALLTFLMRWGGMSSTIGSIGFGSWVARFFDPHYLTFQKVLFYLAILAAIVGLVLLLVGKSREKKGGYKDEKAEKAGKYFRGLFSEMKKIVWPDGKSVVRNTLVVIAVCAVFGVIIGVIDFGLSSLIDLLVSLA